MLFLNPVTFSTFYFPGERKLEEGFKGNSNCNVVHVVIVCDSHLFCRVVVVVCFSCFGVVFSVLSLVQFYFSFRARVPAKVSIYLKPTLHQNKL